MIGRLYRPLVMGLPLALIACMNPAPPVAEGGAAVPLGVDLGGSGSVTRTAQLQTAASPMHAGEGHASHPRPSGDMHMAHAGHGGAHGAGTVNSIDPVQHKINLSHQPIPDIGWPTMTMDFAVAPSVDLRAIKPGARVNFTIEQAQGGMYEVRTITPAGGDR